MKKTFTREELLELGLPHECDGGKIISNEITGQRRWSTEYSLIFQLAGQAENEAWATSYSAGSTEEQDESPWEYEKEVDCWLVHKTEKTVTVWE